MGELDLVERDVVGSLNKYHFGIAPGGKIRRLRQGVHRAIECWKQSDNPL
jgi:hypothetical protein